MSPQGNALEEYVKNHGGARVLRKILISNNGMAATKAIMSMRQWAFLELGSAGELEFIVMASRDDLEANAEFIRLADGFVEVPPGKNTNNYANVDLIVQTAKAQNVDCVWPGWGHASENPALPRALAAAGIMFLGPTAPVMHALGDKIASTILAQSSKVPCIPWNGEGVTAEIQSDGSIPEEPFKKACLQSYEEALQCAKRIGYPVVLKASEGGGGKGIRKCANEEELKTGWEQVTTEVVGSPIFMMQLCTGARHLEVQLVGDEHGSVVALIGRDCSTQRRFQKIFEEGPPTIAAKEDFREAEKAAQRLAMSVGYRGAGTVEYLYKPDGKGFYFLELNPRLQVEHPVTEGITGVNVPALQLQIGMGIPLQRVPDIRRFYGLNPDETSKIDFLNDAYVYPNTHVIAARITAENPDDAFRPTSGKIERIRFQSTPDVWGYFSIGANGGIHEFADSQFGHIFASGPTREHARKALQIALKNISVVGEIRNPTEYLVELAETDEFKNNTIDTAWLDKLIAEKTIKMKYNASDMIFYAACLRAHLQVKEQQQRILDGIKKGHMPLQNSLKILQSFQVELAYESTKYNFQVSRTSQDAFALTIGETTLEACFREQPDGSLYVKCGDAVAQISGVEEPLCLRLCVEGQATITFPRIRDPSELRSDFNGKLVRYLHADGADIKEGEPFAELEAMKMIMSLRSGVAGKIHHTLGAGAIVAAGDLLATLDLADPSKVQMVKPYTGAFQLCNRGQNAEMMKVLDSLPSPTVNEMISAVLCGFCASPKLTKLGGVGIVQQIFKGHEEGAAEDQGMEFALDTTCKLLGVFLENERFFASLAGGDETQTIQKFQGPPEELLSKILAHTALKESLHIVSSLLRSLSSNFALEGAISSLPKALVSNLQELQALPDAGCYGQVKLLAQQLLAQMNKPLSMRREDLRNTLFETTRKDLAVLANSHDAERRMYFGLDLISSLFSDEDPSIRSKAAEVYILRTYRGYTVQDIETVGTKDVIDRTPAACLHLTWTFAPPGVQEKTQKGYAIILPDMSAYESIKTSWMMPAAPDITEIHILVAKVPSISRKSGDESKVALCSAVSNTADMISAIAPMLDAKQCVAVNVLLAHADHAPSYLHFHKASGWREIPEYRNMRPTLPFLIELPQIQKEFTMSPLEHGRIFAMDFGVTKDKKTEVVFARGASHIAMGLDTFHSSILGDLLTSCDFIERAMLDPVLENRHPAAQIFLHSLPPIPGTTARDCKYLQVLFGSAVQQLVAESGSRVLKLRISKIEVKVWIAASPPMALRLVADSSMGWEVMAFQEVLDAHSGSPISFKNVETQQVCSSMEMLRQPVETQRSSKRTVARRAGSTYIYDFPALFRISLTKLWMKSSGNVPERLVVAKELVLEAGELVEREQLGNNKVGMVVFQCTLRTPEYPEGREIILIGNDVTVKAGSFGVEESDVFHKASELARKRGIPRIYIACNSGARIGGVEELKSIVQVEWVDNDDLLKGFRYLYIPDADMQKLPPQAVESHAICVNGERRHVLDAVIGAGLASTKGGVGVECLQGSGLIAGETSRAYEETFTLSYATGRSVGIGAYLNRLGQRNIQMVQGPMILTGAEMLNKVLGQQVYTTMDQLGGPHIMVPNGVTHELVQNDQDGVEAILRWLSYVPESVLTIPPMILSQDPASRQVQFMPSKSPYDPRHMLAGVSVDGEWQAGFCDDGSFNEYLAGWGKSVVVGRGRLGGMPIGIVAVETRGVERHIPADPQEANSSDVVELQAGQVWYPDSAYKTAQAIRDFNHGEHLPLLIFANWRGFSGGTRDMFAEVLKYGSMIVDALVEYKQPVTIYIPPNGELRGGAWVVLDPKINSEQIEMFADVEARGGILEPPAAAEVYFKKDKQILEMMHRCDDTLKQLDARRAKGEDVAREIQQREKLLLPVYQQVAWEYCDLHDRAPRMKSVGAIREGLKWTESREYLHWRIRRRVQENSVARQLMRVVSGMSYMSAMEVVTDLCREAAVAAAGAAAEDRAVATWIEENLSEVQRRIEFERQRATEEDIYKLISSLSPTRRAEVVRDLNGYLRVAAKATGQASGKA